MRKNKKNKNKKNKTKEQKKMKWKKKKICIVHFIILHLGMCMDVLGCFIEFMC